MKKILFVFSIVFLCNTLVIAQKTINKTDFEYLVDYANCKYVMAFINKHDDGKTAYFQSYQKNVEPKLQTATLDKLNNALSYDELHKLLDNNIPAQKLAEKINERKNKYNDYQDDISLINSLSTSGWYNIDLSQTAATIQNGILGQYKPIDKNSKSSNPVSEAEVVKTQTIQTSTQVEELQAKFDQLQNQYDDLKNDSKILDIQKSVQTLALVVFIVLFVLVVVFVLLFYFFFPGYIKRITEKSKRLEQKFVAKNEYTDGKSSDKVRMFEDKLQSLERKFGDLQEKFNKNFKTIDSENQVIFSGSEKNSTSSNEKFFKTKNGKILQEELPNSFESSFRVFNINNNEAEFAYCGGIVNSDFFDGVCIFQNNPADVLNKSKIETAIPGMIKKDAKGNWIVEKPATIKFL
jgi:hypothetical protein